MYCELKKWYLKSETNAPNGLSTLDISSTVWTKTRCGLIAHVKSGPLVCKELLPSSREPSLASSCDGCILAPRDEEVYQLLGSASKTARKSGITSMFCFVVFPYATGWLVCEQNPGRLV